MYQLCTLFAAQYRGIRLDKSESQCHYCIGHQHGAESSQSAVTFEHRLYSFGLPQIACPSLSSHFSCLPVALHATLQTWKDTVCLLLFSLFKEAFSVGKVSFCHYMSFVQCKQGTWCLFVSLYWYLYHGWSRSAHNVAVGREAETDLL
jgi:hypothetical protein